MKIIYMGTPDLAVRVLEDLMLCPHQVVCVVTQPDRPKGRGRQKSEPPVKIAAQKHSLPVLQPLQLSEPEFINTLMGYQADLIVVVAFSILPMAVIGCASRGAVNIHASLLPKYRGAAPIQWALYHGESITGATLFQLDAKMDTGMILGRAEVPILLEDTTATLGPKIVEAGSALLLKTLDQMERGTCQPEPQNHQQATHARKLKKEDGLLNWNRTSLQLYNQIRAFNPYPICYADFTQLDNKTLRIHRAELTSYISDRPGELKIGPEGALYAACADKYLKLHTVQLEGKPKVDSRSLLNGLRIPSSLARILV